MYSGKRQKLTCEIIDVTPAMAAHLLASAWFERQRNISPHHVARLSSEMTRGSFLAGTPIWVCVANDGTKYIVNGNHTLSSVVKSGVTIPLTFVYERVRDEDAAAESYITFDIQRIRTWQQAANAVGISDKLKLSKEGIMAFKFIKGDFKYDSKVNSQVLSRAVIFNEIKEYESALALLHSCLDGSPRNVRQIITRFPIFAVAMVTAKFQPSAADEFWGKMARDEGLVKGDPQKALLDYMRNNPGIYGSSVGPMLARAAAVAWGAFFDGRELTVVRPNSVNDLVILGTPWGKNARRRVTMDAKPIHEMEART